MVIAVAAAMATLKATEREPSVRTNGESDVGQYAVSPSLVAEVTRVPVSVMVAAATSKGEAALAPRAALPVRNKALSLAGKPQVIYIGAEYCPFCAAERWALVMALSKFGTFRDLSGTTSSDTDVNPSTPTFSFYGSSYDSPYVSFVPVEMKINTFDRSSGTYPPLQALSRSQLALMTRWDAPPYTEANAGTIPFLYIAGRYLKIGAQYVPNAISGENFSKAAVYLTSGKNAGSKGIEASAGLLLGDICSVSHDQPTLVCSQVPRR